MLFAILSICSLFAIFSFILFLLSSLITSYNFLLLTYPLLCFSTILCSLILLNMSSSRRGKTARPKIGVIQLLQKELNTFDDETCPLLHYQHERLQLCLDLLENPVSTGLSEAQRFGRLRARKLLFDILRRLGEEVFLLCATAISITRLARISDKTVLEVRQWWKTIGNCPNGLIIKAKEVCNDEFRRKYTAGEIQLAPQ